MERSSMKQFRSGLKDQQALMRTPSGNDSGTASVPREIQPAPTNNLLPALVLPTTRMPCEPAQSLPREGWHYLRPRLGASMRERAQG